VPRLIGRGLGLVELRVGGPAFGAQILARVSAAVACANTPSRHGIRPRPVRLKLQIDFIECGQRLTDFDVSPTSTSRLATLPGTRNHIVSIRGLIVPTKLRSGDSAS